MRWLAHRGGALDFLEHQRPSRPAFPGGRGARLRPATILGAVTPVPDSLSEYQFAGLLRGSRTELVSKCLGSDHRVPASAEIVLEGVIHPGETALEGPFGDHTGYYNEQAEFPVFTIERVTSRRDPIYHSTYRQAARRAGDARPGAQRSFVPLLQKQFTRDRRLLSAAGRLLVHRLAVVSIKKQYPGHAKRVMFGIWSFLRQFMYTKFIIVVDDDRTSATGRKSSGRSPPAWTPPATHDAGGQHPIDTSTSPQPGCRPQQDGPRRHQQVARRNESRMGPGHRDGRRGEEARRRCGANWGCEAWDRGPPPASVGGTANNKSSPQAAFC